ncbi:MAG TPA: hypothetical protein VEI07_23730, partial [Planctomycetaceae bacterium]|nr:hypothetical protein [Planctomycetaceae bacterium]
MELPTCPSCHQSVLDDDAELCPFCNAPLKKGASPPGKANPARPSAPSRPASPAPPAASPTRPTSPSKPPATQRPSGGSSAKAPPPQDKDLSDKARSAADDALAESFKVDSSAGIDVPQASRQRSQSRPYKVRCPMCDTVGYIPRSAAGKEIRCANRECMVPVFIAPRPEKKQEEEAAAAKKLTPKNLLMAAMAVGLIAFAVGFFLKNQPPEITKNPQPEEFHPKSVVAKDKGDEPPPVVVPVEKPMTLGEERKPALTLMARAAEDKSHNRSRPLCQRLTAHTAAECGDLETAGKFLEMLEHAENGLTFYRVPPLTSLAWRDLTGGRHEAPRASPGGPLDEATRAAADLPVEGAFSLDAAAWLAAALTVAGRDGPARALVAKFPASGSPGRLAAAEARAEAWNTCDVDRADQNRLLVDGLSLQLPLVVELVVARGFPSAALHLAESTPDESLRTECEVAW